MQSDVTQIKRNGEFVTMPLSLYEELRAFCRNHGETDLPGFARFVVIEGEPVEVAFDSVIAPTHEKHRKFRGDVALVTE